MERFTCHRGNLITKYTIDQQSNTIHRSVSRANANGRTSSKLMRIIFGTITAASYSQACWRSEGPPQLVCGLYSELTSLEVVPLTWWDSSGGALTCMIDSGESGLVLQNVGAFSSLLMARSRPTATREQFKQVSNLSASEAEMKYLRYLPAVARFELVNSSKLEINSMLPYRTELDRMSLSGSGSSSYPLYDYVYMFHYAEYTYFVPNDVQPVARATG